MFLCLHQEKVAADELLIRGKADTSDVGVLGDGEECIVPNGRELSTDGLQIRCGC